ncbi:ferritin-like domain-containing protein [Segetibacter sp. 3557_3]|uniref:ferritin-like domain-containing protein n=1 Tax=Segetibacter sp. 3557_3 TaxID=2547429 RepID=UPI00105916CC|nr:ferritin-like domain-containing protein [Segetibacter sp. 3557_3]TDH29124.1 ferritin-like domain-containing protein [Segetibacter sp. 3557_3]
MTKETPLETVMPAPKGAPNAQVSRRKFLGYAGATSGLIMLAAACKKNDNNDGVDLGSGDFGILNYAYALEQLEAAFYAQAVLTPYTSISANELAFLTDIRDHEIAHREFFKRALGDNAIPGLEVDFSTINFMSRDSVLGTAQAFEDLGVTAYNGAGYLIKDTNYLLLAGKIVSVEARHAALIRELRSPNTFLGDQVDNNSVNISRTPSEVLGIAGMYIKTKINANNLPTG